MDLDDFLGRPAPGAADIAPGAPVCSRKGCTAPAEFVLVWNNPKVHAPDRRKTWAACPAHRDYLSDFLGARGFLLEVLPLDD